MITTYFSFLKDHWLELFLSIPKTILFNFRVLPIKYAIRLPIIISYRVKLDGSINRKTLIIDNYDLPFASTRIGLGGSPCGFRESSKSLLSIRNGGKIIFKGKVGLSKGFILSADGATLTLGNNFRCNYSTTIDCAGSDIFLGDNIVCGWEVTIRNNDGHTVIENGRPHAISKEIIIHDNVWLCACSTVLKGCVLGEGSILAYRSMMISGSERHNVLYGGSPAKALRFDISWKE